MKRFILAGLAAFSLAGCVPQLNSLKSEITPARCESALKTATRIEDIAAFLAAQGVDPELATRIATYVAQGRLAISQVCDALNGPPPVPEEDDPGANQVVTDVTS